MKKLFLIFLSVIPFLGSCAALMDAHYVAKPGKENSFVPQEDKYEAPRDPTIRY